MRHHVTGMINDKNGALVATGILQAAEKRIETVGRSGMDTRYSTLGTMLVVPSGGSSNGRLKLRRLPGAIGPSVMG